MTIKSITSMQAVMECSRCQEIELRLDNIVRDPADNHALFGEYVCAACNHFEIMDSLDDDPTPDEAGEPPVTMSERYQETKPR